MDQTTAGNRSAKRDRGERDHFIPVRKIDLLDAVIRATARRWQAEPEREKFRQLCRLLEAIYHHQYFDQLERLRNDYYYFSPEIDNGHARLDAAMLERAYQEMIETLKDVLLSANFTEIPHDEINQAHREHALVQVDLEAPRDDYREVRFFRRGHHLETIEIPEWLGWRKRRVEIDVYDDVVLLVTMKSEDPGPAKKKRSRKVRPGAVLLEAISATSPGLTSTRCFPTCAW